MSRALGLLAAALCALAACATKTEPYEGETHWLEACQFDEDCGVGHCLCGICSTGCETDRDCDAGTPRGLCYAAASPGLSFYCDAQRIESQGVCLAGCERDDDCPAGTACSRGACLSTGTHSANAEASSAPPQASDFLDAGVDPFDFSEPTPLPDPDPEIFGDASALEGHWRQIDEQCGTSRCVNLEVSRPTAGGALVAKMWWSPDPARERLSEGPFAPAVDGTVGYPIELAAARDYAEILANGVSNVRYTIFDGTFNGDSLEGWISPMELWSEWCPLQSPQPTGIGGAVEYRCADPFDASGNELHDILCTQSTDWGRCPIDDANEACACIDEQGTGVFLRCTPAVCECDETSCEANLRQAAKSVSIRYSDDELVGEMTPTPTLTTTPFRLKREARNGN